MIACLLLLVPGWVASSSGSSPTAIPKLISSGAYSARLVRDQADISIIELTGNYDEKLADGSPNNEPRRVIAQEFFRTHPDAYDMLVVFTSFPIETGDAVAFHHAVRNNVAGIGRPSFDNSPLYGSRGKLQGYIDMAALTRYQTDYLNQQFDFTMETFAHEFLHQFGAFVKYRKPDGTLSTALLGKDGSHWSNLLDTSASLHYGNKWRDNGNGTFTSTAVRQIYSPLDLYLMGFKKREDVAPFFLIDAPGVDPAVLPLLGATVNGTRRMISIDDIIAAEGPRIPDAAASQKDFRLVFIYVVRPGQVVSQTEIAALNNVRRAIGTRFSALTEGQGHVNVFVEPPLELAPGSPTGLPPSTSPPASAVNIQQGVAWLKQKQSVEGSWADTNATTLRDSAVALVTLQDLDPGYSGLLRGAGWLSASSTASTDFIARKLLSVAYVNRAPIGVQATELTSTQNADGGWGAAQTYASNPLDTALGVQTLLRRTVPLDSSVNNALGYLVQTQNIDGGWGNVSAGASRTTVTAQVLLALQNQASAAAALTKGKVFLATRQNTDGGFGDSPSSIHDTAHVIGTLITLNATTAVRANDALQYLSVNQRVDGSWSGSVYSTALALNALARANAMNWVVTGFSATPARTTDGQRVALNVSVKNSGNRNTPAGTLRLYGANPASGGVALAPDAVIPLLVPGASTVVTVQWNTLGKVGAHTLYAVVDPDRTQQELSVADNIATLAYSVDPAQAQADLLLSSADISITPPQPTQLPATLSISALLTNAGLAEATNVKVVLWQGEAADKVKVGETIIAAFPARATRPATFAATITKSGVTKFSIEIDPDAAIAESDESNNLAAFSVSTDATIDLEVLAADISLSKPSANVGDDLQFSVKLRNRGTVDTPDFGVRYSIASSASSTDILTNTIRLKAGEQTTHLVPWRANIGGALLFGVELDSAKVVNESDETNNSAQLAFNVSIATGPNLAISFKDLLAVPSPALEGSALALSIVLRNTGNQPVSNAEVAFYLGDPAQGGQQIGATQVVPALASGAEQRVAVSLANVADTSSKLIYAVADPASKIANEFTREDNQAFITVSVRSLPDLATAPGNLKLVPGLPKPGESVALEVRVDNLGQQPANNVLVRVFDGDPAAGGVQVGGDQTIVTMAAQTSATANFNWTFPAASGDRTLFVQVDPLGTVAERNKANNNAQLTVGTQSGDFAVNTRYFSPNGDSVLDTVDFTFRFQTPRNVTLQVVSSGGAVVRRYSGADLSAVSVGRWTWDGKNDRGSVVRDGDYRIQVLDVNQGLLGEASVALDTNRSSLIDAIDTPFGLKTNLTCAVPQGNGSNINSPLQTTPDGLASFFTLSTQVNALPGALPGGIYRINEWGADLRQIVPNPSVPLYTELWTQVLPADDGSRIVMLRGDSTLWTATGGGGNVRQIPAVAGSFFRKILAISRLGDEVYALQGLSVNGIALYSVVAIQIDNPSIVRTLRESVRLTSYSDPIFSPDKNHFAFTYRVEAINRVAVVNVESGLRNDIDLGNRRLTLPVWSPDSRHFSITSTDQQDRTDIEILSAMGVRVHRVSAESNYSPQSSEWSDEGSEIYIAINLDKCPDQANLANCASDSVVKRLRIESGEVSEIFRRTLKVVIDGDGIFPGYIELRTVPNAGELLIKETSGPDNGSLGVKYAWYLLDTSPPFAVKPLLLTDTTFIDSVVGRYSGNNRFGEFGRAFYYSKQWVPSDGGSCQPNNSSDSWAFRTLQNLTVDLRISRSATGGALKLRGTAADKNFAKYILEYASILAPEVWLPIAPIATRAVIDGELGQWVPPAPGIYLVRLSVEDLAGNKRAMIKRVAWGENALITDLYRTPEYISPNADGVQDKTIIHYRVVEPVNLEFTIHNAKGERVRGFTRSHPAIGVEVNLEWDGRNDLGAIVPDGLYRLTVLDYEFAIKVDSTPPAPIDGGNGALIAQLDVGAYRLLGYPYKVVEARLVWAVKDVNFKGVALQSGEGLAPSNWLTQLESNLPDIRHPNDPVLIPLDAVARNRYRVVVDDLAGNTATETLPVLPEVVEVVNYSPGGQNWTMLEEWGGQLEKVVSLTDFSRALHLELFETIYAPTVQVAIEYQGPTTVVTPGPWSERILGGPFPAAVNVRPKQGALDGAFVATWDMRELTAAGKYFFRLRLTDQNGKVHRSPNLMIAASAKFEIISANLPSTELLQVEANEKMGQLVQRIDLLMSSSTDPAFVSEQAVWSRPGASTIAGLGVFGTTVQGRYRTCTPYSLRLRATLVTGGDVFSAPVEVSTCSFVETIVKPVVAACGIAPLSKLLVEMKPVNRIEGNVPLALLEFGRKRADGSDDILYSKVNPSMGSVYSYELSTAFIPEGEYAKNGGGYFTRVTDIDYRRKEDGVRIVSDRTPLQARITYPGEGQRLCAKPQVSRDGTVGSAVDVETDISDKAGFDYILQHGVGEAPTFWSDALEQDPACLTALNRLPRGSVIPPDAAAYNTEAYTSDAEERSKGGRCSKFIALSGKQHAGRAARLNDVHGVTTARLLARDWGGYQSCPQVTFFVDGRAEVLPTSIDRRLFSPATQSLLSDVTLTYRPDEALLMTLLVYRRADVVISQQGYVTSITAPSPLRKLAQARQIVAVEGALVWDGRDDAGTLLADGDYVILPSYEDACGNKAVERPIMVEIDRTSPLTRIALPAPNAGLSGIVEVTGDAADENLSGYVLEYGEGIDPQTWTPIKNSTQSVANNTLGSWSTLALQPGPYVLRLRTSDLAGNSAEARVAVTVKLTAALVTYLEAVPEMFSPNGDGRLEQSAIRFALSAAANATLTIFQGATPARTLLSAQALLSGAKSVTWDGRNDLGQLLADGKYLAELQVVASANASLRETVSVNLTLDASAPVIQLAQPAGAWARGNEQIIGSISDANLADYLVTLRALDQAGAAVTLDSGTNVRSNFPFGTLTGLAEGRFELAMTAADQAENRSSFVSQFEIDNTAPKVTLSVPQAGIFIGPKGSPLNVTGAIDERNFKAYKLNLGQGAPPAPQTELAAGFTLPLPSILHALDITRLADGAYRLQLAAEDMAGWVGEALVDFTVDNTAPIAQIVEPAEGAYIRIGADVKGSATDNNFKQFKLDIAPGPKTTASRWTEFASATAPVSNAALGRLGALPPDGIHTIRLSVTDKADNVATALLQVIVDTAPPATPLNLSAKVENRSNVVLTWNAVVDTDLGGYAIYRDGARITTSLIAALTYTDSGVTEGDHSYTVTALDKAGNESLRSTPATVRVSLSTPIAQIINPARDSVIAGLYDIKGTAYSARDFKEYRISIGAGAAPATYQLLRRSPLALQGEVLAQWNTFTLPEGALYTIQLEAEDIFGSIARDSVTVKIDNRAPARPLNLRATASGSDVTLLWDANTEPDIDGYLLYRGESLVNQIGPAVGDLRAFIIKVTTWLDKSVADGTHDYSVVAVDKAGNSSDASAPARVVIDTRAPKAVIVKPLDGAKVDRTTYVLATSPDSDVAQVQFQYRLFGTLAWNNIGAAITKTPFALDWDLQALAYADYELRAVATDQGARTDPQPGVVRVTRTKLDRPATPGALQASVNGGAVTLTWTAVTSADLAGYVLDRLAADNSKTRITPAAVTATRYVDAGLADASYRYSVAAIDTFGNESDASALVSALIFTPQVQQPYSPTEVRVVTLSGSGQPGYQTQVELQTSSGTQILPPPVANAQGEFAIAAIGLEKGDNRFKVTQTDASGNKSKPGNMHVMTGDLPTKPLGLSGTVTGLNVSLSWNANTELDLSGYFVRINGEYGVENPAIATAFASSDDPSQSEGVSAAVDGNINSVWSPVTSTLPQWLEFRLVARSLVSAVTVLWDPYSDARYSAAAFEIQGWDGETWITLAQVAGNVLTENIVTLARPYFTDRMRVLITARSAADLVHISEVFADAIITEPANSSVITPGNGGLQFSVAAFTTLGLVSPPSASIELAVGDSTPPAPVVLQGSASGRDITLSWTASISTDVAFYEVMRDGQLWVEHTNLASLTLIDAGKLNGTYTYSVIAVDQAGNRSLPSNQVVITIDSQLPPAAPLLTYPVGGGETVTVTEPTAVVSGFAEPGSQVALDITLASAVSNMHAAGSAKALLQTTTLDVSRGNDVRPRISPDGTWVLGRTNNAAALYRLSAGVADDTVSEVKQFSSLFPARVSWAGNSKRFAYINSQYDAARNQNIKVFAFIDLADLTPRTLNAVEALSDGVALSHTGASAIVYGRQAGRDGLWRVDVAANTASLLLESAQTIEEIALSPGESAVAFTRGGRMELLSLANNAVKILSQGPAYYPSWAHSGESLLFTAEVVGLRQVFLHVLASGETRQITTVANFARTPSWSPDGKRIAYVDSAVQIRDLATGAEQILPGSDSSDGLVWTKAGYLTYQQYDFIKRVRLAGHFRIADVLFEPGENRLSATATDAGNLRSAASATATVFYSTADRPDLAISAADVILLPAVPSVGEAARITLTVRNIGARPATNAAFSLVAVDAAQASQTLKDIRLPTLASGESSVVVVDWTPAQAGVYQLSASVDRLNEIAEVSESNNVAVREVNIVTAGAQQLAVKTGARFYPQNAAVAIDAQIVNGGAEFSGTLETLIEDLQGFTVQALPTQPLNNLLFGQTRNIALTWNSGNVLPGKYRVHARLKDSSARMVAEAFYEFAIEAPINVVASVVTDKAEYAPQGKILITGRVTFPDNAGLGINGEARIRILDATQQVRFLNSRAIAFGVTSDVTAEWTSGSNSDGQYSVVLEVLRDGLVLASANANFSIVSQSPLVALLAPSDGTVAHAPANFVLSASASSPNAGGSVSKVEFFQGATKLGEALTAPYNFNWNNVAPGAYALRARVTDNLGATADSAQVNVIVNALPSVAVTAPANNAVFAALPTIVVTAEAADSDGAIARIEVFANINGNTNAKLGECAVSPCSITWSNVAGGSHSLTAKATDNRGGSTISTPVVVIVEHPVVEQPLPPTVALTAPAEGAVFHAPASLVLTANAASPNNGGSITKVEFFQGATKLGEALSAPYVFNWSNVVAGAYVLKAKATDNRGVSSESAALNIVVNALPSVSIASPINNASFTAPANVTINALAQDSDGNISKIEIFQGANKLGECVAAPCSVTFANAGAGAYVLTAKAGDNRGGSTVSAPVTIQVQGLAATLAVTPQSVIIGERIDFAAQITNQSAAPIAAVPLRLRVFAPPSGAPISEWTVSASLEGNANYTWAFSWDSSAQPPGTYSVELSAVLNGAGVVLAQNTLILKPVPIKLEVTQSQSAKGKLLVLLSCKKPGDDDDDDRRDPQPGPKSSDDDDDDDDDGDDDDDKNCVKDRKTFIEGYLKGLGVVHHVVTTSDAFKKQFRSGAYNVYWLSGGALKLKDSLADEMREAVFRGDALLVDGVHDERNKELDEVLGVKYKGKLSPENQTIVVNGTLFGSLSNTLNLVTVGRANKIELQGGTSQAVFGTSAKPSANPAIVSRVYGFGNAMLFAFDWNATLKAATQSADWKALAQAAFVYLTPAATQNLTAAGHTWIKTIVKNQGVATDVEVILSAPAGGKVSDSAPLATLDATGRAHWQFALAEKAEKTLEAQILAPSASGSHRVDTIVNTITNAITTQYGAYTQTINVVGALEAIPTLVATLKSLSFSAEKERKARDAAVKELEEAQTKVAQKKYDDAIEKFIDGIDKLSEIQSRSMVAQIVEIQRMIKEAERKWFEVAP